MAEVDKAVERIRATRAYRLLVVGYRCLLLGPLMLGLTIGAIALWSLKPPLVWVPIAITFATVFAGVAGVWVGLITLHSRRLMPRGGTNRHAALMRAWRHDVVAPIRRTRGCPCRAAVATCGSRCLARPVRSDFEDWARRTFSRWNAVTIASTILGLVLSGLGLMIGTR
ncbi:hypothetical protein ACTMS0_06290 [Micromonospora sp. H33]|uniref:hypothetical protein n=1 Tax=Micromonospora sp. H33 TaxID=3452215 RepID=UPI003F8861AE